MVDIYLRVGGERQHGGRRTLAPTPAAHLSPAPSAASATFPALSPAHAVASDTVPAFFPYS